jgi:hypothetical protein
MSNQSEGNGGRREEFRAAGNEAVERIKEIIREGKAREIIVKKTNGDVIRKISLDKGIAAGGLLVFLAPALAAIGGLVALLAEVRIEVVRKAEEESGSNNEGTTD